MKKILQYSLYALMAYSFIDVHAADGPQCAASSEQTASAQRLAEVIASLPCVVGAYDALLKSSASNPVTAESYAILYDFIMKLKDCSEGEICEVGNTILKVKVDLRALAIQWLREQGRMPDGSMGYYALVDSVISTWGGLPGRTIKKWASLFDILSGATDLIGGLAYGNGRKIRIGSDKHRAYLNIASILSSQGKGMSEIFPQSNCCFHIKARYLFETDQDYVRQIHELNKLCHNGAANRVKISIDGEVSAKLLSEQLDLPDNTVVKKFTIKGNKDNFMHVTERLLQTIPNIIRFAPNVECVWVKRAILEDGAAFCNFLKRHKVRKLVFTNVDSSLLRHDAGNIGGLLSQTLIESFSVYGRGIVDAVPGAVAYFWTAHLPQTVEGLYLGTVKASNKEKLKMLRTALERYLNIKRLNIGNVRKLDLQTIAYMALHPTFEGDSFTSDKRLKQADRYTEPAALANVLMAFRKYCHILHNPYEHVGLLMDTLTRVQDFRGSLPSTNPAEDGAISKYFVEVTSQFRKAVEDKYDDFAGLDKDTLNNEFRQLVLRENLSLASRILRLSEDTIQPLFFNDDDEADNDTDIAEPQLKRPKKD